MCGSHFFVPFVARILHVNAFLMKKLTCISFSYLKVISNFGVMPLEKIIITLLNNLTNHFKLSMLSGDLFEINCDVVKILKVKLLINITNTLLYM